MDKNFTQCIKCGMCQDLANIEREYDPQIVYSSGLCFECFCEVVINLQIAKTGDYCFGTGKDCTKPKCAYREKCYEAYDGNE